MLAFMPAYGLHTVSTSVGSAVEPKPVEPAYEAPPPTIEVKPSPGVPKKSPLRRAPAEPAEPSSRPPLLVHAKKAAVASNSLVSRR